MKKFSVWDSEPQQTLKLPCRNRYGNVAFFQNYSQGAILIGFGDNEGFEPDKDAMVIDKKHLPKILKFLKECEAP